VFSCGSASEVLLALMTGWVGLPELPWAGTFGLFSGTKDDATSAKESGPAPSV
jgi:hypothetical protein